MRAIIHILSPLFLILSACGGSQNSVEGPSISGTIEGTEGGTVYFQKRSGKGFVALDSSKLKSDGSFAMSNPAGSLDFYFLSLNGNKRMVLITDSTSSIKLTVDSARLGESVRSIEGSEHTELLYRYFSDLRPLKERMDSLRGRIRGGDRSKELQKEVRSTQKEIRDMTVAFVKDHPNSPAIIPALSSVNPRKHIDLMKSSYKNLKNGPLEGSAFLANLAKKIQQVQAKERQREQKKKQAKARKKLLKKGKDAPDISLKTPKGNVKSLSSLEGQVVLIDFWASWCKPCLKTIPKLKKLYKKYNDQGFEIYGVSLDKKKKDWVKAIEKYDMNWVHVSDLKYFNSAAAQKYNIRAIPFTVLVDKNGKIIASGLRGQELVKKIEEVMG